MGERTATRRATHLATPRATHRVVVTGPHRGAIRLGEALEALGAPPGPAAAITVGWRESESVTAELEREAAASGRPLRPLLLGERVRRVFDRDPELAGEHRALQERIRAEEQLYGARLRQAVEARHAVSRISAPEDCKRPYTEAAWDAVLAADRFHTAQQRGLWERFRSRVRPSARPALCAEIEAVRAILRDCAVLLVAGGHVAVIRNRLMLLDLGGDLARLPIVAWSGGAMALSPRVVLFHDRLPYGSARPEILGEGTATLPGAAFFPDASRRLDLADREGLGELAVRVAPQRAVLLDPGDRLDWDGTGWTSPNGIRLLATTGEVENVNGFTSRGPSENGASTS